MEDIYSRLNLSHYLPSTPEKIERLRKIINNRPVVILLPGMSLQGMREWITDLHGLDLCYATVNDFWVMEDFLGKRMDIIMCSASQCNVPSARHVQYLMRKDENVFITEPTSFHHSRERILETYGEKIIFFKAERGGLAPLLPTEDYPLSFLAQSSLSVLLSILLIGKPKMVVLFGADGGGGYIDGYDHVTGPQNLAPDTVTFNVTMPLIIQRLYKMWDLEPIPMLNCSLNSKYTFPNKIDYKECLDYLRRDHASHGDSMATQG